jgi:hypothetical protein
LLPDSIFSEKLGFFGVASSGYYIVAGRSTKIKLIFTDDLNPHKTEDSSLRYLPDRGYFTALLDIRGFLQ